MSEKLEPVTEQVVAAIQRVLARQLKPLGFERAEVRAGRDHDGDPVLFIDAYYRFSDGPIDVRAAFGLEGTLQEALEPLGEDRFPHVRHHFDERQQVA